MPHLGARFNFFNCITIKGIKCADFIWLTILYFVIQRFLTNFFEIIPQTMFWEVTPVIIGPIFESSIHPYDPVLKKLCSKLIGDTTPILCL